MWCRVAVATDGTYFDVFPIRGNKLGDADAPLSQKD